jgi:hypothetical protein
MFDELQFAGLSGHRGRGAAAAQISVRSDHLWIFVEEVLGTLQVWSAPPCRVCVRRGKKLERCQLHHNVKIIASQLELL